MKDPSSGKVYYANTITKQTQWTAPEGWGAPAPTPPPVPVPTSVVSSAPKKTIAQEAGWKEMKDPSSGKIYYANTKTRETSWSVPVG